jgi:hypothetical protein
MGMKNSRQIKPETTMRRGTTILFSIKFHKKLKKKISVRAIWPVA